MVYLLTFIDVLKNAHILLWLARLAPQQIISWSNFWVMHSCYEADSNSVEFYVFGCFNIKLHFWYIICSKIFSQTFPSFTLASKTHEHHQAYHMSCGILLVVSTRSYLQEVQHLENVTNFALGPSQMLLIFMISKSNTSPQCPRTTFISQENASHNSMQRRYRSHKIIGYWWADKQGSGERNPKKI